MDIQKGAKVRQILPPPVEGVVTGFSVDQETGKVMAKIEWSDAAGDHSTFLRTDQLEVVPGISGV